MLGTTLLGGGGGGEDGGITVETGAAGRPKGTAGGGLEWVAVTALPVTKDFPGLGLAADLRAGLSPGGLATGGLGTTVLVAFLLDEGGEGGLVTTTGDLCVDFGLIDDL